MTIRFTVHSIAKRADAIALVDSGATENFMNLTYAKWLRLPIKKWLNQGNCSMSTGPKTKPESSDSTVTYTSGQGPK